MTNLETSIAVDNGDDDPLLLLLLFISLNFNEDETFLQLTDAATVKQADGLCIQQIFDQV